MELTPKQRSHLRALAHSLRPVVTAGQRGLTPAVLTEIDIALGHHELVKVRLNAADREARKTMTRKICDLMDCHAVQNIGHIAVFYRPAEKPAIDLSRCT